MLHVGIVMQLAGIQLAGMIETTLPSQVYVPFRKGQYQLVLRPSSD